MGILDGKKVLVTGVLTDDSFAFHTARRIEAEGGEIVLSGFGRGLSLTKRVAGRLATAPEVIEIDVTVPSDLERAASELDERFGRLDGVVHSIAFAPELCLGHGILAAEWADVATAIHVSTYSLKALCQAFLPLFDKAEGGSVVGFDFDATVAWPGYDWMGIAKAGLESLTRYLARDLGPHNVRVNLLSVGPLKTLAERSIPGHERFRDIWAERAPLGWDEETDHEAPAAAAAALLSDFFLRTSGEIIHVDGGFHAVGV